MKRLLTVISPAVVVLVAAACASSATVTAGDNSDPNAATAAASVDDVTVAATCPAPTPLPIPSATAAPSLDDLPPPPTLGAIDDSIEPTIDATTLAIMAAGPTPVPTVQPTSTPSVAIGIDPAAGLQALPNPADLEVGAFMLLVNGAQTEGSGIAFIRENDDVHVRVLAGTASRTIEFDLTGTADGRPRTVRSAPAVVYGGDAVSDDYQPADGPSSNTSFVITDGGDGAVFGSFDMSVCHYTDSVVHRMVGVYRIAAEPSTEWNCDWGETSITNCRFIDG